MEPCINCGQETENPDLICSNRCRAEVYGINNEYKIKQVITSIEEEQLNYTHYDLFLHGKDT